MTNERHVGTVATLHRYPVKSMLGEGCGALAVAHRGVAGDRAWAIIDKATGKVASAKRPKLWRSLLGCGVQTLDDAIEINLPDGTIRRAGDPALDDCLSALTGRPVRLSNTPPDAAEIDRSHPEAQIAAGLDADVASDILVLGAAAPPGTFLDYAPLHLITSATLDGLDGGEVARYRPNIVIHSPSGTAWFPEKNGLAAPFRSAR